MTHPAIARHEQVALDQLDALQSFGALLVLDHSTATITHASANAAVLLKPPGRKLAGRALADLAGAPQAEKILNMLRGWTGPGTLLLPDPLDWLGAGPMWVSGHLADGRIFLDVEPVQDSGGMPAPVTVTRLTAEWRAEISTELNLFKLLQKTAELINKLIGYSRVMIYRFQPDLTGEVMAEVLDGPGEPYLGLRYPATDIPVPARKLFATSRVRVLASTSEPAVRLEPAEAIRIGISGMRAPHPCHVDYLRNMGVGASLSVAIPKGQPGGDMWGLISCHHHEPILAPPPIRQAVATIGEELGALLAKRAAAEAAKAQQVGLARARRLAQTIPGAQNGVRELLFGRYGLFHTIRADGYALVCGNDWLATGHFPAGADLPGLAARIASLGTGKMIAAESFPSELGPSPEGLPGLLALVIDQDSNLVLMCFARELVRDVLWGGDPDQPFIVDEKTGDLNPRSSFAQWRTIVRGQSRPWRDTDLVMLRQLGGTGEPDSSSKVDGARFAAHAAADLIDLTTDRNVRNDIVYVFIDASDDAQAYCAAERGQQEEVYAVNRGFRTLFGLEPGDPLPEGPDELAALFGMRPGRGGEAIESDGEADVWSPVQGLRHLKIRRHVVFEVAAGGREYRIAQVALSDITQFRRTEELLRHAGEQAHRSERAQARLLSGASHELRTPLNAIIGFSELMALETFGPMANDRYRVYAEDIRKSGQHLLAIVNDLLDLSRMNAGANDAASDTVLLAEIIEDAVKLISEPVMARGQHLLIDVKPGLTFKCDRRGLFQAVLNILSNAVKYTPDHGRIEIKGTLDPLGNSVITVSDNGLGISPADQHHLFTPFYRAGSTTAQDVAGTGLGLTIVKALIEAHGGRVALTSRLGHGTMVTITLPADLVVQPEA